MKGNEFNQSIEIRKMLKSRNSGKVYEEFESKLSKMTHVHLNQKDKVANKTFFNNSNENENLLTEMHNRNQNNNKIHKKTLSTNYTKIMKISPPKIIFANKENLTKNKSITQNDFLKKNQLNLKTNKSINHLIRNVEIRSNNVSPINSSFTKKQIQSVKATKINNFVGKNEILETEKDSNHIMINV